MRPARLQGARQPPPRHASLNEALDRAAVSGRRGLTFVAADESESSLGWDAVRTRAMQVAGALGVAVGAIVLAIAQAAHGEAHLALSDFHAAFLAMGAFCAIATVSFWRLPHDAGAEMTRATAGRA